ncbi:MAG: glycosyl hydrolase 53 family protein [Lewinella sp.]|nr:glycosyl hydrolase 53 family protein [Lewinella sp.]
MKVSCLLCIIVLATLAACSSPQSDTDTAPDIKDYSAITQVASGEPTNVKFTAYSTTLMADGKDKARLRITVIDSLGREITSATNPIHLYIEGEGKITTLTGESLPMEQDTAGLHYHPAALTAGELELYYVAGPTPHKTVIKAASPGLWAGEHEIHTIPADAKLMRPGKDQLPPTTVAIDRMIGADISWLPQLEARGVVFREHGQVVDPIFLLREQGFNFIRLRIFVNPENAEGYSPELGFCGLDSTLAMARRVQAAGMKLLLDFHYSDYWADPQKQFKPQAWIDLDYPSLQDTVTAYTARVLRALTEQGTPPAMVQVGNEINHGLLWPDGHISHLDGLAGLLKAGVAGVKAVLPDSPVMMHIALGGQNDESVFWLDNMLARGVQFDLIGLSYYPRWHGTLEDLQRNLYDLIDRYHKPLNVVEYSDFKAAVNEIVFSLPDGMGVGTAIWEPLSWRSGLFTEDHEATDLFQVYDEAKARFLDNQPAEGQ